MPVDETVTLTIQPAPADTNQGPTAFALFRTWTLYHNPPGFRFPEWDELTWHAQKSWHDAINHLAARVELSRKDP